MEPLFAPLLRECLRRFARTQVVLTSGRIKFKHNRIRKMFFAAWARAEKSERFGTNDN
ncbi:hypothetical protein ACVIHI_008962 [Bradyrhizobium sp. USDA 4524]|uniref:hypothetical protein n=1 Tax=unclassified Bradyrhizobium TaxID=2631580 RepID=UPI00209E4EA7|nr:MULTISPECIES: hypothetical protein [unclassified Bradyrhizobium]MCP1845571.1 hypothetical protein [Bradyrhizobium sp. USDA 4538]MCP1907107.1 hypothetical protein [Bradyrhizobium sp. USDA 4537]MCP1985582.1 hypothetical protein [Bradyrhizobium sp. USDA 4539]